jgi:undecaprenyl-diphosphatase
MNLSESIVLGILQGVTEFLPISSSGHLTLAQHLFGIGDTPLAFDIFLHFASLLAVLIFFRKKILSLIKSLYQKNMRNERLEILFICISTLITAAFLPLTKPVVLLIKGNPAYLIFTFLFTAVILVFADRMLKKKPTRSTITLFDSIITGLLQGLAVFPGISRSGSTIFAGLTTGLKGEKAVEYSFLLAIPAILGAVVLEARNLENLSIDPFILISGCIASFIVSLISLRLLVFLIKKTVLRPFSLYLIMIAGFILYLFWL